MHRMWGMRGIRGRRRPRFLGLLASVELSAAKPFRRPFLLKIRHQAVIQEIQGGECRRDKNKERNKEAKHQCFLLKMAKTLLMPLLTFLLKNPSKLLKLLTPP